jgi:hypothetical protein
MKVLADTCFRIANASFTRFMHWPQGIAHIVVTPRRMVGDRVMGTIRPQHLDWMIEVSEAHLRPI